ncbi:MAG: HD domain-containing protein [Bacilli bacterium]|nr:HD domain-containing protein [Bacilli bacterium]
MDLDRLKHSYSVAKKMIEIGINMNLSEEEIQELFILGFNHDIGYEYTENGKNHGPIGGELLRKSGYKYWKEVFYHGILTDEYESLYLNILNMADMQIDKYGNDVGYESRLEDIKSRYGEDSVVYERVTALVNHLKKEEKAKSKKR